jgi:HEAT repeat protein
VLLRLGLNEETDAAKPFVSEDFRSPDEQAPAPVEPPEPEPGGGSAPADERSEPEDLKCPADPIAALDEAIQQLAESDSELGQIAVAAEAAAVPATVPEDAGEAAVFWMTHYGANPLWAARNLRELAAKAPERFVDALLPLCQQGGWGDAAALLARLLSTLGPTAAKLCDPAASLESSICIAKALMRYEPHFDARFARSLLDDDHMTEAARQRGLAVMQKLGGGGRLIPILIQFLRDPDGHIRSKAALMFGQTLPPRGIVERLMGDVDARVRANFVEGLWNCPASHCRALFRQALDDSNHRVVGNALVGLHRAGESREVMRHLSKMVRHPEALFRAAAVWVIGQTGEQRYADVLRHMARDPDPLVRRSAFRSLRQIRAASPADAEPQSGSLGDRGAA